MNSRIGISTGWRTLCGTISGRDSSTFTSLIRGQKVYIWVMGS